MKLKGKQMILKRIIATLVTIFSCRFGWTYCEKATVPFKVCEKYMDTQFTYDVNTTVGNSTFKEADFMLRVLRENSDYNKYCNDTILNVSAHRTINRAEKTSSIVYYRVLIGIKEEHQSNYSLLTATTGAKIDECFYELSRNIKDRLQSFPSRFALEVSAGKTFTEPLKYKFYDHYKPDLCSEEIKSCPVGSTELNKMCECLRGRYLDEKLKHCSHCPKDTYQEMTGMFNCTSCPQGSTTKNETGSWNSTACIGGTRSTTSGPSTAKPTPVRCGEGEYMNNVSQTCIPCPKNMYQDLPGSTSCKLCPSGLVTSATGSSRVDLCIDSKSTGKNSYGETNALAIALPVTAVVVIIIAGIIFFHRWQKKRRDEEEERLKQRLDDFKQIFVIVDNPGFVQEENEDGRYDTPDHATKGQIENLLPTIDIPPNLEIPREYIKLTGVRLGRGNFGEVKQVLVQKPDAPEMLCAAKMARGCSNRVSLEDMVDELEIHLKLEGTHENVVNLVGVCSDNEGPFYLIMEYCDNGSLVNYLRAHEHIPEYVNTAGRKSLSLEWKLARTLEVCCGMKFLAREKIVHRDLAARNVLLDSETVAKISDFGMAKDVYLKSYYKQRQEGSFPLRWMALDAIQTFDFTEKTDVWSFGVLMWEIFTDGKLPYYDIIDDQSVAHYILSGKKLKRPPHCSKLTYNIMLKCWSNESFNRPTFRELHDTLSQSVNHKKPQNSLQRRLSRDVIAKRFGETKRSIKRTLSRKGSKHSVASNETQLSSRKHSQSSFDRIMSGWELQNLDENPTGLSNEGADDEENAEEETARSDGQEREDFRLPSENESLDIVVENDKEDNENGIVETCSDSETKDGKLPSEDGNRDIKLENDAVRSTNEDENDLDNTSQCSKIEESLHDSINTKKHESSVDDLGGYEDNSAKNLNLSSNLRKRRDSLKNEENKENEEKSSNFKNTDNDNDVVDVVDDDVVDVDDVVVVDDDDVHPNDNTSSLNESNEDESQNYSSC